MSASAQRLLWALRPRTAACLDFARSQSPGTATTHARLAPGIRSSDQARQYCQKANDKSGQADEHGSERASTSGRGSEGPEDAANGAEADTADARQRAAAAAAKAAAAAGQAQESLKAAAASAASFTTGVAQELFKQSPFGAGAAKGEGDKPADGAGSSQPGSAGTDGPSGAPGQSSAGSFASSAYERAQSAYRGATGGAAGGGESADGTKADGTQRPVGKLLSKLSAEIREAVMPAANLPSVMRARSDADGIPVRPGEGPSELAAIVRELTLSERLALRFGDNPVLKRMGVLQQKVVTSDAAKRAQQLREDVRDRLEMSDSEVVNRMADMREGLMTETESAITYREIRSRHPTFDMPTFLLSIKNDVPIVIKAYLEGDEAELKEYCSKTMLERLMGIYKVTQAEGQISDPTILEYSDVDMVDMKMLDGDPVVIVHFSCQQINCIRDKYGNVVSGSPEEVNRVYYYWALQQDGYGLVTQDGKYLPPRWMLSELLLRGMHQLL